MKILDVETPHDFEALLCRFVGGPKNGEQISLPVNHGKTLVLTGLLGSLANYTEDTIPYVKYIYELEPAFPDDLEKANQINLVFKGVA